MHLHTCGEPRVTPQSWSYRGQPGLSHGAGTPTLVFMDAWQAFLVRESSLWSPTFQPLNRNQGFQHSLHECHMPSQGHSKSQVQLLPEFKSPQLSSLVPHLQPISLEGVRASPIKSSGSGSQEWIDEDCMRFPWDPSTVQQSLPPCLSRRCLRFSDGLQKVKGLKNCFDFLLFKKMPLSLPRGPNFPLSLKPMHSGILAKGWLFCSYPGGPCRLLTAN